MKVSKIEHMRTAVGRKGCKDSVTGMVYKSPFSEGNLEVRSHLAKQNENNQRMYSLFGGSFFYLEREFEGNLESEEFKFQENLAKQIREKVFCLEKALLKKEKWNISINGCSGKKWEETAEKIVEARIERQLQILWAYNADGSIDFRNEEGTQEVDEIDFN